MLRHFQFALAVTLVAAPVTTVAAQGATVVLVVRHAERAPGTGDVPLSAEGEGRARALMGIGREAGVQGIITTQFLRTRQTADPLAESLGVTPHAVSTGGSVSDHAAAVAAAVRERYAGRTVLVVGHSNTVGPIVAALGGATYRDLCDSEYDAIFVVVLEAERPARTVKMRFGIPSPPDPACSPMR